MSNVFTECGSIKTLSASKDWMQENYRATIDKYIGKRIHWSFLDNDSWKDFIWTSHHLTKGSLFTDSYETSIRQSD